MTTKQACNVCWFIECTCNEPEEPVDDRKDAQPLATVVELPNDDPAHRARVRLLAKVRSGSWLDAQDFPELEYAIPGVIPEGFTVLAGAPKVGKSWFILSLCLALSSGGKALGVLDVPASTVLYLALEDGDRRLQDRIRQLIPGDPIPKRFHYATKANPGEIVPLIRAWLEDQPETRLIVLDTLGKVMPPAKQGETTYQRDYRVGSAIKSIADEHPGLAFVVVHHDRKAESGDFVDAVSGTNGIAGSADTIVLLARDRHAETALLNVTGRDVHEAEYGLTRYPSGAWQLTGGDLEGAKAAAREARDAVKLDKLGDRMREVVAYVNAHEVTTPRELAEELGIDPRDASKYLHRALERDLIDKAGRGDYVPKTTPTPPVVSVVMPYSEEGTPTDYDITTDTTHPYRAERKVQ